VVRDDPALLEAAFSAKAAGRRPTPYHLRRRFGWDEADFVKQLMAQLGEVLFWKIAIAPGRPMAFGKIGKAFHVGLPG
jgi:molybdopterin molybdotransferase